MSSFDIFVEVGLRPGISDPQGATIQRALPALGYTSISQVRSGKAFRFKVEAASADEAQSLAEDLCRRFLTNPVIESSSVTVSPSIPA